MPKAKRFVATFQHAFSRAKYDAEITASSELQAQFKAERLPDIDHEMRDLLSVKEAPPRPRSPTIVPRYIAVAETVLLGTLGLWLTIRYRETAFPTLAVVALVSLPGMLYLSGTEAAGAFSPRVRWTILRWLVVLSVVAVFGKVGFERLFTFIVNLPEEMRPPIPKNLNPRISGLLWAPPAGLILGAGYFFGVRLYIFLYAIITKPGRFARLASSVWVARQFNRSLFDPLEIVPGYSVDDIYRLKSVFEGEQSVPMFLRFLVWIADLCVLIATFCAGIAFKMSVTLLWPLAYLAQSSTIKQTEGVEFVSETHRSRLSQISLWLSVSVIAVAAAKIVIRLNAHEFGPRLGDLIIEWSKSYTLWEIVSPLSAVILLLTTKAIDRAFARIHDLNEPPRNVLASIRWAKFGVRLREFLVAYTLLCLLATSHPRLREVVLPRVNPVVFELPDPDANADH